MQPRDVRKSLARYRKLATWSWTPEPSFYETLSDEDRVIALGSCLAASPKWAAAHGRQVEWLAEQGLSEREAVGRYREWRAAQAARFRDAKVEPLGEVTGAEHGVVRNRRRERRGQRP